jgi:hypothetical protein
LYHIAEGAEIIKSSAAALMLLGLIPQLAIQPCISFVALVSYIWIDIHTIITILSRKNMHFFVGIDKAA